MRILSTLAAIAAATLLCGPTLAHDGVHIENPYARSTGAIGSSGAVFLVILNHGAADDRLIDATSDIAVRVELHRHKHSADGVMQMLHVPEGFVVPAKATHALARGGDHVMLLGLTRPLAQGDAFDLTLVFEKEGAVVVTVVVDNDRKAGAMDPSAHASHATP